MPENEVDLLSLYSRERDPAAFRALVERHSGMVYATCLRTLGNAADAEDASQRCFLKLARNIGKVRAPVAGWLHQVARRESIDMRRREIRRRRREAEAMNHRPDAHESTWRDIRETVDEAISKLPERYRVVIILHYLEGRSQEEVAEELGLTQSAVSKRVAKGIELMRRNLGASGWVGSAALLTSILTANALESVPATLSASLGKMALAGITGEKLITGGGLTMFTKIAIGAAVAATVAVSGYALMPAVPQIPAHAQVAPAQEAPSRSFNNVPEVAAVSGRAMREMARLAMKIELAEQHGDEVRIPGWTEEDDAALVSAIVDFIGAVIYCDQHVDRGFRDSYSYEDFRQLLLSDDMDAKVGAALVGAFADFPNNQPPSGYLEAMKGMANDADPSVRAAGLFYYIVSLQRNADYQEELEQALDSAIKDEAIEVRFAAALAGAASSLGMRPEYEKLIDDESASVRFTARLSKFLRLRRPEDEGEKWRMVEMMLTDPNPIARSAAFPLISGFRRSEEDRARLAELVEATGDEWLKLNPMAAMMQAPGNNLNLDAISDLAASPKRSHRALAASSFFAMRTIGRAAVPTREGAEPQQPTVNRLPEPVDMWSRSVLLFLSAFDDHDMAEARWTEALQSDDELARLISLMMISSRIEGEAPAALIEGIESSFSRGVYAEKLAAVQAMSSRMTPDQFTDAFKRAADDGAGREELALFLNGLVRQIHLYPDNEQRAEQSIKIIDVIISADDPYLTAMLARNAFWYWYMRFTDNQGRLSLAYLMEKAQPEAILLMLEVSQANFNNMRHIIQTLADAEKLHILTTRLETMAVSPEADIRDRTADAVANIINRTHFGRDLSEQDRLAMERLLVGTISRQIEAGEDGVERGLGLLAAFLSPQNYPRPFLEWKDAGPELRAMMVDAVKRADDQAHRTQAAEILCGLYRQNRNQTGWDIAEHDPGLMTAMERARLSIMANGAPEEQIVVMCGILLGTSRNMLEKLTVTEMEKRFMAGGVPAKIEIRAWEAMQNRAYMSSAEFGQWMLQQWENKTYEGQARQHLRGSLSSAARNQRSIAEAGEAPLPQWITDAERVARRVLADKNIPAADRIDALYIFVQVCEKGAGAVAVVERIILDETDPIRVNAANHLNSVSPRSGLYARLLPEYDKLPVELRKTLGQSASQSPEAPESDAFFIAALNDPGIEEHHKTSWLFQMQRPETPALRKGIEELKKNRQLEGAVDMVINRWDREAEQREREAAARKEAQAREEAARQAAVAREAAIRQATVGTVQPSAANYDEIVAGLKGEAVWSERDTVNENLTWHALPAGPAFADSEKRQVRRFQGIFGYQQLTLNAIAFGEDKVWMGADKGLLAWDRKTESWMRFAVGGELALMEAPVTGLEIDADALRVTIEPDGARLIYEFNLRESKWLKIERE